MERPRPSRLTVLAVALGAAASGAAAWAFRRPARMMLRSWMARTAVEGASMTPTLLPGDWLLVDPDAYTARDPAVGELVLVSDPRSPDRLLVKRVAATDPGGALEVAGDAPWASTDSRTFGPVIRSAVRGRPWLRYWPIRRAGSVR